MFLSSLQLTLSNPGFTLGYEPEADLSGTESFCLVFLDLFFFYLHPIILKFRLSTLKMHQKGIKKSLDLNLTVEYEKNAKTLLRLTKQFYSFKKLELNLETIVQMTLSLLLYLYSVSSTRTTHSLLALFNNESPENNLSANESCFGISMSTGSNLGFELNVLKCIPTTVTIILNFTLSFISFTR